MRPKGSKVAENKNAPVGFDFEEVAQDLFDEELGAPMRVCCTQGWSSVSGKNCGSP